jgi:hypothetical protein
MATWLMPKTLEHGEEMQVKLAASPRAREAGVGVGGASDRAERALCVRGRCVGAKTGQRRGPGWRWARHRGAEDGEEGDSIFSRCPCALQV